MLALAALSLLALAQAEPAGAAPDAPAEAAAGVPAAPAGPIPSLLSAEPLRGTSLFSAEAGWSRQSIAYAQGLSGGRDLGGFLSFDIATTETRLGVLFRQPLPPARPFDAGLRLSLAWYDDEGGTWIYEKNHKDDGLELGIGATLSRRAASGVVSLLADVPVTVTFRGDGGLVLGPRVGVAYEAPFYGPFTLGLHGALGYRFGVGSAPFKDGMGEASLLLVGSYRVF